LVREIGLVQRAHERVAAGDARGALALLDSYDAEFPRGQMSEEATVLRIQALREAGQEGRAQSLAHAFLEQHGDSPLAQRVRSLLGE
jgi:outer membrane protein assembly factor BamD (BamD/ComL family)